MMRTKYRDTVTTLLAFAVPLIFSGILQQLYHWADAFIVGQVLGQCFLKQSQYTILFSGWKLRFAER